MRLRLFLTGPADLARLDRLVVTIRDDHPWRAEGTRLAGGPTREQVAEQIWGPYRFTPGTGPGTDSTRGIPGADPTGRTTPTRGGTFAQRRDTAILAVFTATGIRLSEMAGIRHHPDDPARDDLDLDRREIRITGKGSTARTVKISHHAARALDRYLRARARHPQAWRNQLWLGANGRGPLTPGGIYQLTARRGRQADVAVYPHRFRHVLSA
jgi:hypothetical protein